MSCNVSPSPVGLSVRWPYNHLMSWLLAFILRNNVNSSLLQLIRVRSWYKFAAIVASAESKATCYFSLKASFMCESKGRQQIWAHSGRWIINSFLGITIILHVVVASCWLKDGRSDYRSVNSDHQWSIDDATCLSLQRPSIYCEKLKD